MVKYFPNISELVDFYCKIYLKSICYGLNSKMIFSLYLLNILNVFLAFIFQILFVKILGASNETDSYFLAMTIIQFINFSFVGFITDLYVQIYNDIKVKSVEDAVSFSNAVFTLVLIAGLAFTVVIYLLAPVITKIFATGFTTEKAIFTTHLVQILSVSILFTFLITMINSTLNANLYIFITYLTNLFIPLINIVSIIFLVKIYGIQAIVVSYVVANFLIFVTLISYQYIKHGIKLSNPFKNRYIPGLLKQNIPLRMGILIYVLRGPITTNIISYFPSGYLTLYNYAEKIILVLHDITNSIILNVLHVKSCTHISNNDIPSLRKLLLSAIRINTLLFVITVTPVFIFFEDAFRFLFSLSITPDQIKIIFNIFTIILPFYLLMTIELPFTYITLAMKKGVVLLKASLVFVVSYIIFVLLGLNVLHIYVVPVAMFLAQIYNAYIYIKYIHKNLDIIDNQVIITIIFFFMYISALITINRFFVNSIPTAFIYNVIPVIMLIGFIYRYNAFSLEFIKEEIK